MLKGISPLISPDLLKTLHEMGHGDELVLADAHFPGHSLGKRVLRADGLSITALLDAVLPLLAVDALFMMRTDHPEELDPLLEAEYMSAVDRHVPGSSAPVRLSREQFYSRAAVSFCVLMTGEIRPYGNVLIRKGVSA